MDPTTDREIALGQLQIQALQASADVQLKSLESDLVAAQAASDWETAKAKQIAVRSFRQALADLAARKHVIEAQCYRLARKAVRLGYVQRGENLGEHIILDMWAAYRTVNVSAAVWQSLAEETIQPDDRETRASQNFVDVRVTHRNAPIAHLPSTIHNTLEMIAWLQERRFTMPRQGSRPFVLLVNAFELLGGNLEGEIAKWQEVLDKATVGTYTIFDPLKFASLPNDPAVAALVGASNH